METERDVQQLIVRMPADLHEQLKRTAANEDLSVSQLVRRLVRTYVREAQPA